MTMTESAGRVHCVTCNARLARDNDDTVCSPCRRTSIETSARQSTWIVRDAAGATRAFEAGGLHAVARHLGCTADQALDVVLSIGLVPMVGQRRRAVLHELVGMDALSHVMAADALSLSRWTVATYRRQLGLVRLASVRPGARSCRRA